MALPLPRRAARVLASLLIGAACLELAARVGLRASGRPYSAAETRAAVDAIAASLGPVELEPVPRSARYALHPFTGWQTHVTGDRIAEDRARFAAGSCDDSFDVLLLGSSVAAGFQHAGAPALAEALRDAPLLDGREPAVLTYGRSAFKQPQQLMFLVWLLAQGIEPDAVLCIDGFNEMALSLANARVGVPHAFPAWGTWGPLVSRPPVDGPLIALFHDVEEARRDVALLHARGRALGLMRSALTGSLLHARMVAAQERWQGAAGALSAALAADNRRHLGSVPLVEKPIEVLRAAAELWERSTAEMMDICAARGIPLLHVMQPNPHVPGSKPLSAEEASVVSAGRGWIRAAEDGVPLVHEARARLARDGLVSLDATMVFANVEETVWVDAGHLNETGNRLLAAAIADALLDLLAAR